MTHKRKAKQPSRSGRSGTVRIVKIGPHRAAQGKRTRSGEITRAVRSRRATTPGKPAGGTGGASPVRMLEALRSSGVGEKKLARVLRKMLEAKANKFTPADRRWAAEECLKLLAAYPSPRSGDAPVQIVVDLPAPQRDGVGSAPERSRGDEASPLAQASPPGPACAGRRASAAAPTPTEEVL